LFVKYLRKIKEDGRIDIVYRTREVIDTVYVTVIYIIYDNSKVQTAVSGGRRRAEGQRERRGSTAVMNRDSDSLPACLPRKKPKKSQARR
jgi:hypothetical protein